MTNEGIVAPQEFKTLFQNTLASIPGRDLIKPDDTNLKQLISYIDSKSGDMKKYAEPSFLTNAIKNDFSRIKSDSKLFKTVKREVGQQPK
jgi:hypothetical protein